MYCHKVGRHSDSRILGHCILCLHCYQFLRQLEKDAGAWKERRPGKRHRRQEGETAEKRHRRQDAETAGKKTLKPGRRNIRGKDTDVRRERQLKRDTDVRIQRQLERRH